MFLPSMDVCASVEICASAASTSSWLAARSAVDRDWSASSSSSAWTSASWPMTAARLVCNCEPMLAAAFTRSTAACTADCSRCSESRCTNREGLSRGKLIFFPVLTRSTDKATCALAAANAPSNCFSKPPAMGPRRSMRIALVFFVRPRGGAFLSQLQNSGNRLVRLRHEGSRRNGALFLSNQVALQAHEKLAGSV